MDTLPLDLSHPAVKSYLALVRLQVLTPLSLLINIATILICAFILDPSIAAVARLYPTALTPNAHVISGYVGLIWLGQVGYCVLLVMARKSETKRAMVSAVGLALVFANVVMALWAVAFVMRWFLLSTILLGILLLLLLFSNLALLIYHAPTASRPLDTALIHAPLRFFLILPLNILFPLSLFIALNFSYPPNEDPAAHSNHSMAALGVLLFTNLLGLVVIALRRDIIWCVAATWIAVSLWMRSSAIPKPAGIYVTAITFTVLHPLTLIVSLIYSRLYPSRIELTGDERGLGRGGGNRGGLHARANGNGSRLEAVPEAANERGPTEVDEGGW